MSAANTTVFSLSKSKSGRNLEDSLNFRGVKKYSVFGNHGYANFLSIFYTGMEHSLAIWEKQTRNGEIWRVKDVDNRLSLEISNSHNVYSTYITTPPSPYTTLGIRLPIITLIVKNTHRAFVFGIQVRDVLGARHVFHFSNLYKFPKIRSNGVYLPLVLNANWNELVIDLAELTKKAFGTLYKDTIRVQVHANTRLRFIYFSNVPLGLNEAIINLNEILVNIKKAETEKKSNKNDNVEYMSYILAPGNRAHKIPNAEAFEFSYLAEQKRRENLSQFPDATLPLDWILFKDGTHLKAFRKSNMANLSIAPSSVSKSSKISKEESSKESQIESLREIRSLIDEELLGFLKISEPDGTMRNL